MHHPTVSLGERAPLTEGDVRLPRPPGVVRRFWARHPWWVDGLVAGAHLLVATVITIASATAYSVPTAALVLQLAAVGVSTAALVLRRRYPVIVLAVVWVASFALITPDGAFNSLAVPLALYALAVYRSSRAGWIGFAASVVAGSAGALAAALLHPGAVTSMGTTVLGEIVQVAFVLLLAVLLGTNIGNRRRYVAALVDLANQLARERDQQARLAAAAERSRIAREMHDIVSHSLTVMVTLADGSAVTAATAPGRASEAMQQVAETGRHALADMRRMLGVLNGDDRERTPQALAPQPGVADLPALLETFRAASLPVTCTSKGVPPEDAAEQLTIYRIVQESLTNALRHARGATAVNVDVRHTPAETVVVVTDDGVGEAASGAGHGLVGMRERVALYGGTLTTGPAAPRGWSVRATVPHGDPR